MASSAGTSGSHNPNYYDLFASENSNVYVIGEVGNPRAQIVRVVHISDTHDCHGNYLDKIPYGHILVHSGDFGNYNFSRHFFKDRDFLRQIACMNDFFGQLPHDYKIFVAGNHEMSFDRFSIDHIQSLLSNAIYLQDTGCTLYGLKFYGTPWNPLRSGAFARGFSREWNFVRDQWRQAPEDTDVLISHMPPWHPDLYEDIASRVKPLLHLFGHDHSGYGIKWKDRILFSNAALSFRQPRRSSGAGVESSHGNPPGRNQQQTPRSSAPQRSSQRHPIVIDVYVVSDNYRVELPPTYLAHCSPSATKSGSGQPAAICPAVRDHDSSSLAVASKQKLVGADSWEDTSAGTRSATTGPMSSGAESGGWSRCVLS